MPLNQWLQLMIKQSKKEIEEKKEHFKEMTTHLKKGKFSDWCNKHGFEKVTKECINKAIGEAERTHNITLKKEAVLARTFQIMAEKRKKK
jgi:hypothetical protein